MTVFNRTMPYVLTVLAAGVSALYAYEPVEVRRPHPPEGAAVQPVVAQPEMETCPRSAWPYVQSRCLEAVGDARVRPSVRVVMTDRDADQYRRTRLKHAVRGI